DSNWMKLTGPGWGGVVKKKMRERANQTAWVDAHLAPGTQELTVDVTAEWGASLQTEAPARGGNIDATRLTELPIATRNPVSLALTLPGVSTNRFSTGVQSFSANGGPGRPNNFLIDGTENKDISVARPGFHTQNPDAVKEVSVQTSNYDAEFGRAGGAVINTITRSGSNNFHGTMAWQYDSTRDDALTNTQSLDPDIRRRGYPPYGTEHIFSGTLGGPLYFPHFGEGGSALYNGRDRSFFFVAYQNQRQASNSTASVLAPSAAGRAALRALYPAGANPRVDTFLDVTSGAVATSQFTNVQLDPATV